MKDFFYYHTMFLGLPAKKFKVYYFFTCLTDTAVNKRLIRLSLIYCVWDRQNTVGRLLWFAASGGSKTNKRLKVLKVHYAKYLGKFISFIAFLWLNDSLLTSHDSWLGERRLSRLPPWSLAKFVTLARCQRHSAKGRNLMRVRALWHRVYYLVTTHNSSKLMLSFGFKQIHMFYLEFRTEKSVSYKNIGAL